ncbi:unnamed protein product, partial [Amoebophrya sp. A25]
NTEKEGLKPGQKAATNLRDSSMSFLGLETSSLDGFGAVMSLDPGPGADQSQRQALDKLCKSGESVWAKLFKGGWRGVLAPFRKNSQSEGACVRDLAEGTFVFFDPDISRGWLASYSPEVGTVHFYILPEEYTDMVKAGSVNWMSLFEKYEELRKAANRSTVKPLMPLPSTHNPKNGLDVVFVLGLGLKLPQTMVDVCKEATTRTPRKDTRLGALFALLSWIPFRRGTDGPSKDAAKNSCNMSQQKMHDIVEEGKKMRDGRGAALFVLPATTAELSLCLVLSQRTGDSCEYTARGYADALALAGKTRNMD